MAYEILANNPASTLNGTINNSVTSLVVTSGASFPSSGNFRILVDSEIMKVTAVSGTTFTVSRADGGTTAASHTSGVAVTGIITKECLTEFRADQILSDTVANKPAAGVNGRIYLPTDGSFIHRDTGSVWSPYGPCYPCSPPVDANFSWVNQGSATVVTSNEGIYLSCPSQGATDSIRARVMTAPSTPYSITIGYEYTATIESAIAGFPLFILRESATGKMTSILPGEAGNQWTTRVFNHSSVTGFSQVFSEKHTYGRPLWQRITNNGTTLTYYIGLNPYNFVQIYSQSRSTAFSSVADQYGFGIDPNSSAVGMFVFHLKES
jgi:hypothetical protein